MLFNSLEFILFFPIVCLVYYLLPGIKGRTIFLLLASYYFYMCWEPVYALLLLTSTSITYISALCMDRSRSRRRRKISLFSGIFINLGILFFYKYYEFAGSLITDFFSLLNIGIDIPRWNVLLPVGISFYIFQAVGYAVDVYRGTIKAEKNFVVYALFISFFPQLVAGPIERAKNMLPQFREKHKFSYENFDAGLRLMIWGFFMKLCVADRVSTYVDAVYNNYMEHSGVSLLLATFFFTFQIYCDFAGYSLIAIGSSKMMGFTLMENFHRPYFAKSIKEFWRRWHISLTTWFRDYIYIPLGGSRAGKWKSFRNTLVIFLVSGFWHGANWTFVAWGAYHALLFLPLLLLGQNRRYRDSVAENSFLPSVKELTQMGATFLLVLLGWILFRSEDISQAAVYLERMFNVSLFSAPQLVGLGFGQLLLKKCFFFTALMFIVEWIGRKQAHGLMIEDLSLPVRYVIYTVLLIIIYGFDASNPQGFIYFQF